MRRMMQAVTVAGLAVAMLACGREPTAPVPAIGGAYVLATIDGDSLPWTMLRVGAGFRREIVRGALVLEPSGAFVDSLVTRDTDRVLPPTIQHHVAAGAWLQAGDSLTFTPATGPRYGMVLRGDQLEQVVVLVAGDPPARLVYRRKQGPAP